MQSNNRYYSFSAYFLLHKIPPIFSLFHRSACYSFLFLLDFLRGFHRVNVQSATISHSFWTSSVAHSASTSNLPLFLVPFGLQPVSATASTSNPPLFLVPFGLQPAFTLLQCPIRHSFSFLLHIYTNPSLKSLTLHPYFPQFSHLLPTTKTPAGDKPCREHLRNIQTIKLYINYL